MTEHTPSGCSKNLVITAVFWCHKFKENHCIQAELTKITILLMTENTHSKISENASLFIINLLFTRIVDILGIDILAQ